MLVLAGARSWRDAGRAAGQAEGLSWLLQTVCAHGSARFYTDLRACGDCVCVSRGVQDEALVLLVFL